MPYSTISKLAWSANHLFMDLQSSLGGAIEDELTARGYETPPEHFLTWPKPVYDAFFGLCMDVLFAPEETTASVAQRGVDRIARMLLAHRESESASEEALTAAL